MAFSLPCDGCRAPLNREVLTVRVSTFAIAAGAPATHRLVPSERPSNYLFCGGCAETLNAYIRYVEMNGGAPRPSEM